MTQEGQQQDETGNEYGLMYCGKAIDGNGTKRDGTAWKRWKLIFKKDGSKYDWNAKAFDPLSDKSIALTNMVEGERYDIFFKMNHFTNKQTGQPAKSRQILTVNKHDPNRIQQQPAQAPAQQQGQADKQEEQEIIDLLNDDRWAEFADDYKQAFDNNARNGFHMLGVFIATFHREKFQQVIDRCKKEFEGVK